jgi:polysaccharide biosynthesis transport protein
MDIDIFQLPGILRRRWVYPAASTALCGVLALGVAAIQTPTYKATTALFLDPAALQTPATDPTAMGAAGLAAQATTDSQLYVMQSAEVLGAVVDKLNLQNDPWLAPPRSGGLLSHIFGVKVLTEAERRREAMDALGDDLLVQRADQSLVFAITAKHPNAKAAADIANATADAYLSQIDKSRTGSSQRIGSSLREQADGISAKLQKAQSEVEAYKAAHGLYSTPTGGLVADQQLEALNQQLAAAKTRVEQQKTIYDQAQKITMADIQAGAIPEALQSNALVSLRTRYAQILDSEAQLSANLGEQHPQLKAARAQAASMRTSITGELDRIRASLKNNYQRAVGDRDALQTRYADLQKSMAQTSDARTTLNQLQSEAQALKEMYQTTLARAETLGGRSTPDPTTARVISAAVPPVKPSSAPKILILIAGLLFGAAAGSALAVLRELLSQAGTPGGPGRRRPQTDEVANTSEPPTTPTEIVPTSPVTKAHANGPVIRTAPAAQATQAAQTEVWRAADMIRTAFGQSDVAKAEILFYPASGVGNLDEIIREVAATLIGMGSVILLSDGMEAVAEARARLVRQGPRVALAAPSDPQDGSLRYRAAPGTSLIRQEDGGPILQLANGAGDAALAMLPGIIDRADATFMVIGVDTPVEEIESMLDSLTQWDGKFLGAIVTEG